MPVRSETGALTVDEKTDRQILSRSKMAKPGYSGPVGSWDARRHALRPTVSSAVPERMILTQRRLKATIYSTLNGYINICSPVPRGCSPVGRYNDPLI